LRWNLHLMVFIKCYIYNIEVCQVTAVCIIRLLLNEHNFSPFAFCTINTILCRNLIDGPFDSVTKFVAAASRALCNSSVI
jgi:hypothetical protein